MKILHVTFGFPPDAPGGTELYVAALCRELTARGISNLVAAPGPRDLSYSHEGIGVHRFGVHLHDLDLAELYGEGDPRAAAAFELILDRVRPDLVHQHALTAACSVQLARRVKARGIPLVFTYHTPTVTCQRGTLLEWGHDVCDGRLDTRRCTQCTLHGLGASRLTSRLVSSSPEFGGDLLGRLGMHGGVWTALRMRRLIGQHHRASASFFELVDRFVALTPWVVDLLMTNGVPREKIIESAHGLLRQGDRPRAGAQSGRAGGMLRIAQLGRLDPTKGAEILVRAIRALPAAPIKLDLFGVIQGDRDAATRQRVLDLIGVDSRLRLLAAIPQPEVSARLAAYDLVAVPSQWLETGPLVVLEALAAGTPVIGSALGGIAHHIRDGVNGILVRPHDSAEAWSNALMRVLGDQGLLDRLRQGIQPVRQACDVAADMMEIYSTVGSHRTVPAGSAQPTVRSDIATTRVRLETTT